MVSGQHDHACGPLSLYVDLRNALD
jgi:hypothetical protein